MYFHVIMPEASDRNAAVKRATIEKVAARYGLEARFPDYLPGAPTFDLSGFIRELEGATFILVDLSHERPSCYYELGVAEALNRPVSLIAEAATAIHQTANRASVYRFADIEDLADILGDVFSRIASGLKSGLSR